MVQNLKLRFQHPNLPQGIMTWGILQVKTNHDWLPLAEPGATASLETQLRRAERSGSARAQMSQVGKGCQAPWPVVPAFVSTPTCQCKQCPLTSINMH